MQPNRSAPSKNAALEALDVARYVADMTTQLEAMAIAARLDMLAYFLGMAKAESELMLRTSAEEPPQQTDNDADGDFPSEDSLD